MRAALICIDRPGALAIRLETRASHLEHIAQSGIVEMAGPFLDADGQMTGSLIVVRVESLDQARDWAAADPYAKAGLFESVTIREWNRVIG